jgi:uncharacterized protein YaaR (DUF327 family)
MVNDSHSINKVHKYIILRFNELLGQVTDANTDITHTLFRIADCYNALIRYDTLETNEKYKLSIKELMNTVRQSILTILRSLQVPSTISASDVVTILPHMMTAIKLYQFTIEMNQNDKYSSISLALGTGHLSTRLFNSIKTMTCYLRNYGATSDDITKYLISTFPESTTENSDDICSNDDVRINSKYNDVYQCVKELLSFHVKNRRN